RGFGILRLLSDDRARRDDVDRGKRIVEARIGDLAVAKYAVRAVTLREIRQPGSGGLIHRGGDLEGAGQQRVVPRQQGVGAGRQPGSPTQIDLLTDLQSNRRRRTLRRIAELHLRIARRIAVTEARQDRECLG
ncbi:hypothetical protein CEE86_14525, partial [Lactobacillus crispatus]